MEYPSSDKIKFYLNRRSEKGARTLSVLGKKREFIVALNTTVGQELMASMIDKHEELLVKIATFSASEEDKANYRAIGWVLGIFAEKIAQYEGMVDKLHKDIEREVEKDGNRR